MNKDIKYCSVIPNFPKNAYMIITHITHKSLSRSYVRKYPFINLVTTLSEVVKDIIDFSKYAAFYLFNKPKRFNWKTKEITDLKNVIGNYNN